MRIRPAIAAIFSILVLAAAMCRCSPCQAQAPTDDYSRVTGVPREAIDKWLKEQVGKSGGDWDHDRYRFYVGFATGHYSTDPVSAIAMRRLAFGLMNNSLAVGDRMSAVAFEMKESKIGDEITLSADPSTRVQFVNAAPYAAMAESKGGHDIERALYETISAVPPEERPSSIILLLNKDNASQAPKGENASLFGSDNPKLAAAIKLGGYRTPLERKVFQMQSGSNTLTVAITAVFPGQLKSLPGQFGERYPTFPRETWQPMQDAPTSAEKLPNPVAPPTASQPPASTSSSSSSTTTTEVHKGIRGWVWILLLIIAIIALVVYILGKRAGVQQPKKKSETPSATKVETVPGSLRIAIGPDEQTITPLLKAGVWELTRSTDGKLSFSAKADEQGAVAAPAAEAAATRSSTGGAVIGKFSLEPDRTLRGDAEAGAQFVEIQGTAAQDCNSNSIKLAPGKRVLCRILAPGSDTKTRLEIVYEAQTAVKR